jgi:hypothetical protein
MKIATLLLTLCASGLASEMPPIQDVLRNAGKAVESFSSEFASVNCKEQVSQNKLDKNGKVASRKDASSDYLMLMRQAEGDLVVEESRVAVLQPAGGPEKAPLLVTSGFSAFLLIFHPLFQHSYEYSPAVEEELQGRKVLRVDFRQIRNARAPSCLRLRGRDYPLEWNGSAWIDQRSGAIVRVKAALASTMEDLGLKTLEADVLYAPVKFGDSAGEHWLPSVATIEASTPLQHWRNTHQFTNYKLFSVDTSTRTETPQ